MKKGIMRLSVNFEKFFMTRVSLILLLFCLSSCYRNERCKPYYLGEFKINSNLITNPSCLNYVKEYKWDTVKLVSNENGKYFFETLDKQLKKCEGKWWITSNDIEGNCFGHIKQKNLESDIMGIAFDISIKINGDTYSLPFRKIDSLGNFVQPSDIYNKPDR